MERQVKLYSINQLATCCDWNSFTLPTLESVLFSCELPAYYLKRLRLPYSAIYKRHRHALERADRRNRRVKNNKFEATLNVMAISSCYTSLYIAKTISIRLFPRRVAIAKGNCRKILSQR